MLWGIDVQGLGCWGRGVEVLGFASLGLRGLGVAVLSRLGRIKGYSLSI